MKWLASIIAACSATFLSAAENISVTEPSRIFCTIEKSKNNLDADIKIESPTGLFAFPDERLKRGLSVFLVHSFIDTKSISDVRFQTKFGCKIVYDLWEERYDIYSLDQEKESNARLVRSSKSLHSWPFECLNFSLKNDFFRKPEIAKSILLSSALNPPTPDQLERTKSWLASKGIGSSPGAGGFVGRAAVAIVRLNAQASQDVQCEVKGL